MVLRIRHAGTYSRGRTRCCPGLPVQLVAFEGSMSMPSNEERAHRPQIAVVIPTYNRAATLVPAVESVLSQSLPDIELIVVDDGSTDGSIELLQTLSDSRLTVLEAAHGGACRARNMGVAASTARYVSFLDSDDTLDRDWASVMTSLVDGAHAAFCSTAHLSSETVTKVVAPGPFDPFFPWFIAAFKHSGSYVLDRAVFEAVGGFDVDLRSSQHTELGWRILERYGAELRARTTNEPLLRYTVGSADGIRANWKALAAGSERLLETHAALYERHPGERASAYYRLGRRAERAGDRALARRAYREAARGRVGAKALARWIQTFVARDPATRA